MWITEVNAKLFIKGRFIRQIVLPIIQRIIRPTVAITLVTTKEFVPTNSELFADNWSRWDQAHTCRPIPYAGHWPHSTLYRSFIADESSGASIRVIDTEQEEAIRRSHKKLPQQANETTRSEYYLMSSNVFDRSVGIRDLPIAVEWPS